jgi:hypothetical protein
VKKQYFAFIVFSLSLFCLNSAVADSFAIKPYLFSILGQQVGVAWQYNSLPANVTTPGLALYQSGKLIQQLPAEQNDELYSVTLPLAACGFGNDVSYKVDGQSAPVTISEVPCADATDPVKFTFLADAQEGTAFDKQFAQQIAAYPGVAILNGGDLVQTGTSADDWRGFFSSMEPVGGSRILYPAVGNHEYRDNVSVPMWKKFFKTEAHDATYAFDMGPARVIVLNSNFEDDPSLKMSQLEWLENELRLPSKWKIVFFHHPGFSVGFFNSPAAPKKEYVTVQDYYIPLFEKYGVDLVLNGHVHLFETSQKAGIHYLIVGPAGGKMGIMGASDPYKLKSAKTRSIVNLEVTPDHLRALSTGINGEILDDLLLAK